MVLSNVSCPQVTHIVLVLATGLRNASSSDIKNYLAYLSRAPPPCRGRTSKQKRTTGTPQHGGPSKNRAPTKLTKPRDCKEQGRRGYMSEPICPAGFVAADGSNNGWSW